jgi:tRNA modification GTPase
MAQTIFAQATPPGRSGVAVIRISGPQSHDAARALGAGDPPLRQATLRRLRDPRTGAQLDSALVLRFAAPHSFTGEDCVELHVHGGPAVCRSVQGALMALPDLRLAEAGEFTRRALMNGKIDLAQAEGLGDLLEAETASQARQAMALMDGKLSGKAAEWRLLLIEALAWLEACIDFSDEEIPSDLIRRAEADLQRVVASLDAELAGSKASERLRTGYEVALVGAPNVGKSTLLNALAKRDVAITSEIAGTTRDVIEVRMDLAGLPVTVIDLAGLRRALDPIEEIGIGRARQRASAADLRIFLVDSVMEIQSLEVDQEPGDLVVLAKADVRDDGAGISGRTGQGLDKLINQIVQEFSQRAASASLVGHERQREAVTRARNAGARALSVLDSPELAAEDIRHALSALDFLIGAVDVEAVLDVIFGRFCIGK